ncbi:MFS transporter [Streptomyces phyllanthi]|uniref:MFS transporter n=1 Tax=Streptomyces phyllanthi TaxID=1803180 RepID=A0A5N8VTD5_9ACTN|nr:MFS transporter [Streptomyces phyllanthi]MPY38497.1 MFS transporter [Streptomyces phyllanthi]
MRGTVATDAIRSRRLLMGYFAGLGVVMAVWGARMPAVQQAAELSTAALALVLLAAAIGMVLGLQVGGRLAQPSRHPILLTSGTVGLAVALAALGLCRSQGILLVGALVFGAAHGVLDVAANSAAVRCQDAYGRPIMAAFHAAYSLGALAGASLAAATAHTSHTSLFAIVGAVAVGGALAAAPGSRCLGVRTLAPRHTPSLHHVDDQSGLPRPRLWLLGALAASCLLGEGAAADWAAVHLHSLDASAATSAAAFALYSAAMAGGRLAGDRLTARFGAAAVVRTGAVLAATGLTMGLVLPGVEPALLGWAAFGLGLSVTVPSLITAAGTGGPRAVATVAVTGYLGLLAGPALVGALASITTLPTSLLLPALLAAAVAALSHQALENSTP